MMCEHCEATVKKALEGVPGVQEATPSAAQGTAVVRMDPGTPEEALAKAVEGVGYVVHGVG